MTTLNTIIEEEKESIQKLIEQHLEYDEDTDTMYFNSRAIKNGVIVDEYKELERELDIVATTAMQRAYEAGQEARVDDQKTNEEIVEETFDEYVNYWSGSPKGKTHRVGLTKQELAFVLTLKDQAHRKEIAKAYEAYPYKSPDLDAFIESLTPTKEVTEVLTNHRYDPGDEKRNPMRVTKEVTEELKKCPQCGEMKSTVQHYPDNYANMNGDAPNALEYCCYECHVFNTECI